ncbi:MAG: hypothetical protein GEV11_27045 [Streptosporangiales bacterium]|nr:hypothetical protein [Streptosporangiales bacterium]
MTTYTITVLGFAALAIGVVVLELLARLRPEVGVPSAGECLGYLMRTRAGRVLVLLGWWWTGWHFFAR